MRATILFLAILFVAAVPASSFPTILEDASAAGDAVAPVEVEAAAVAPVEDEAAAVAPVKVRSAPKPMPIINDHPANVDEGIATLEEMIKWCQRENNRAGYFTTLYLAMTRSGEDMRRNWPEPRKSEMGNFMAVFMRYFFGAWNQWAAGLGTPERASMTEGWRMAFEAFNKPNAGDTSIGMLAFAGVLQHVHNDLGLTVFTVPNINQADFDAVNPAIGNVYGEYVARGPAMGMSGGSSEADVFLQSKLVGGAVGADRSAAYLWGQSLVPISANQIAFQAAVDEKQLEADAQVAILLTGTEGSGTNELQNACEVINILRDMAYVYDQAGHPMTGNQASYNC